MRHRGQLECTTGSLSSPLAGLVLASRYLIACAARYVGDQEQL